MSDVLLVVFDVETDASLDGEDVAIKWHASCAEREVFVNESPQGQPVTINCTQDKVGPDLIGQRGLDSSLGVLQYLSSGASCMP